jgi:hypothetical protein
MIKEFCHLCHNKTKADGLGNYCSQQCRDKQIKVDYCNVNGCPRHVYGDHETCGKFCAELLKTQRREQMEAKRKAKALPKEEVSEEAKALPKEEVSEEAEAPPTTEVSEEAGEE